MIEPHIFGPFVRMVQKLPAQAMIPAFELEYRMLRNDLERSRYGLTTEARSILYFLEFVQMAKRGDVIYFVPSFPWEHVEFYRQTLVRLVEANQLPHETLGQFDRMFVPIDLPMAAAA